MLTSTLCPECIFKRTISFLYSILKEFCEYYIWVEKFQIWDVQEGFDLKEDVRFWYVNKIYECVDKNIHSYRIYTLTLDCNVIYLSKYTNVFFEERLLCCEKVHNQLIIQ